jgi:hypothetical protein
MFLVPVFLVPAFAFALKILMSGSNITLIDYEQWQRLQTNHNQRDEVSEFPAQCSYQ